MTREGQGSDPDQTPPPPTTTRWAEEPVTDDELSPPFVPGGTDPAADAAAGSAQEMAAPQEQPDGPQGHDLATGEDGIDASEIEPARNPDAAAAAPDEEDAEPFPFEVPYDGPDEAAGEEVEEISLEEIEAEPVDATAPAAEGGEFEEPPTDLSAPLEEAGEPVAAQPGPDGWEPSDDEADPMAETPAPETPTEEEAPAGQEPVAGEPVAGEPVAEGPVMEAPDARVGEVVEVLEDLASRLREEGPQGVISEMSSPDRLTAVVAAVLAGHLSRE